VNEIRSWSGSSNGRFHIDFLGVRTDCAFFPGLTPAKVGRIKTSLPLISELLIEYEVCALAASAAGGRFSVLEIGAAWGVWTARGAMMASALGAPVRTVAIEAQPAFVEMMRRHYVANAMSNNCHRIIPAAVSAEGGEHVWFRFEGRGDVRGRMVADDWVAQNAGNPPASTPEWLNLPCRDGNSVARVPAVRLKDVLVQDGPFSFVHVRPNTGQSRLISAEGLTARNIGVVVVPGLKADEAKTVDAAFAKHGFRPVLALNPDDELRDQRAKTKLRSAIRVAVGNDVSDAVRAEMSTRLKRFAA
jgi:FkbM family methyltransferase